MASASQLPEPSLSRLTWIGSDRRLARQVGRRILRVVQIESAGGVVMLLAAAAALIWANSGWHESYSDLFHTHINVHIGSLLTIDEPLEAWINDALMVIFFFVVGLEIKHEIVVGHLREPTVALLPAVAALGGMVLPAVIYVSFNAGGEGSAGWGIPMATDIAFAVGVLSLLGNRVSASLKVYLLTLAIVDDIGAIIVIAVFYTQDLSLGWLLVAVLTVLVLVMMRISRIWYTPAYIAVGIILWLALFESGVHATIAGVILGLFAPARPLIAGQATMSTSISGGPIRDTIASTAALFTSSPPQMRRASFEVREHVAVTDRLALFLHPWTSFVVVPIFAFANAGVALTGDALSAGLRSPVTLGIVAGLVFGKLIGVSSFTWLAVRSGVCSLPEGRHG